MFFIFKNKMNPNLLKTGANSIVLGPGRYGTYFKPKTNKLLKVTRIIKDHDEFRLLANVRSIYNYKNFYAIPEDLGVVLKKDDSFYKYLEDLVKFEYMTIFKDDLYCYYMNYAGKKDLLDIINSIDVHKDFSIFKNYKTIYKFTKQILSGLKFLHEKDIAHLDIKSENIMYNEYDNKFRIIDFGFSSKYPFDDYIQTVKGTPGYFPKQFDNTEVTESLPMIYANDMNHIPPMKYNRRLVYKIDSYCFGRTLQSLFIIFEKNYSPTCFCNCQTRQIKIILEIMELLLRNNVYTRPYIKEILHRFF